MHAEVASSPDLVISALQGPRFDLLLMDLNYARDTTSGREGLDLVSRVLAVDESLPVVAMTGWATLDLAVEAMRCGVRDFVCKPWDNAHLMTTIRREIEKGRQLRSESHQRSRELESAHHVQRGLLPRAVPQIEGWSISADWKPADGVGGDYFDLIPFGPARMAICIADVMGKGVSAGLIMSNLQAVVRAIATEHTAPADVCARVNRAMCGKLDEGRFITFSYCLLDAAAVTLTWCNAGHCPALLVHADGTHELLSEGGMVIGVFEHALFSQHQTDVAVGDRIVLYTDGITEAEDDRQNEFGVERLAALAASQPTGEPAALRNAIFDAVARFASGHFRDDATVIVLSSNGLPGQRPR